ncbi:MAG: beta-ketoacyl-ACP synthase 3 [Thermoguttaceae bacterium]|jgi:3-oxoacyl-(acyl-carrier-protein) synthase III
MDDNHSFRVMLYLPAQGAAETDATIIEWLVAEGDRFQKGQTLAQIDSAKSVFDFQSPCRGRVIRLLHLESETVSFSEPVIEIETSDPGMKGWRTLAAGQSDAALERKVAPAAEVVDSHGQSAVILGVGGYVPHRIVTNAELVQRFPHVTEDYVYQVTGILQRRWAAEGEKPSDMALAASLEAIRRAGIDNKDIDAVIVATTTPDVAMPSTACILQDRLCLPPVPAFDLNAACSGWLYAVAVARGMILSGMARNVLTVGVEMQSRLLDPSDRNAYFLFGDGAGAAIVSAGKVGHRIRQTILGCDTRGLHMARREEPGYCLLNTTDDVDPWIRLDGPALFRAATEGFAALVREALAKTGWIANETRWVIPHQANGRILRAAAKRSGVAPERFFINVERLGNTSSASIPLALAQVEEQLRPDDKLIFCSIGAGMTTAAISVEW